MLGLAAPATLDVAVAVAADTAIELMVDLMELDADGRARVAAAVPPSTVLAAHVPKDAQTADTDAAALLGDWAIGRRLALAGGLGVRHVPAVARWGDVRLIVGSAVTAAADPAAAAARTARRHRSAHPSTGSTDHPTARHPADRQDLRSAPACPRRSTGHRAAEIHGVAAQIDREQLRGLADALIAAERIFVTGEGRSGFMAKAFAMRLMHLGLPVSVDR